MVGTDHANPEGMKRLQLLMVTLCVCSLGWSSPALARMGAGWAKKMRTKVVNVVPRVAQKLESFRMNFKAKHGGFRKNQLVVGKGHVFRTADGGTRRVTRLWSANRGRLLPELVVTKLRGPDGRSRGSSRVYPGNLRRVSGQLGREIATTMKDPVFKSAVAGDKKASALWQKRVEVADKRRRSAPTPPLKPFVNAQGKTIFVDDLRASPPLSVP